MPRFNDSDALARADRVPSLPVNKSEKTSDETARRALSAIRKQEPLAPIDSSEVKALIIKRVQSLPPLPKTVVEVNKLRRMPEPDNEQLLKIIKDDTTIVMNILKAGNSAMYGWSGRVRTPSDALSLLGFKMVSNIAIITAVGTYLKPDLSPYGVDMEKFTDISLLQSNIIERWTDPKVVAVKKDLQFAVFLQEVGKIIVSMVLDEKKIAGVFQKEIAEGIDVNDVEKDLLGQSSAEITALIFTQWKFPEKMTNYIRNSDNPEEAEEEFKVGAQALKIAKTMAPISKDGMTGETIENARMLAISYSFDMGHFEKMVTWAERKFQSQ